MNYLENYFGTLYLQHKDFHYQLHLTKTFGLYHNFYYLSLINSYSMWFKLSSFYVFATVGLIFGQMPGKLFSQTNYSAARQRMVREQLANRDITQKATLASMGKVQRHLFVPENVRDAAYRDHPLPIGYGQTISQPYMVAYMTQSIMPVAGMKVLEIGTGSGYQAAVLAEIVDSVFTIEIVEPLAKQSASLLAALGYGNVKVKIGDGFAGWEEHAPYDAIIVTAAAEEIPGPLIGQLKEGGVMVIPLGKKGGLQTLVHATRKGNNMIRKDLLPVRFVPFVRDK